MSAGRYKLNPGPNYIHSTAIQYLDSNQFSHFTDMLGSTHIFDCRALRSYCNHIVLESGPRGRPPASNQAGYASLTKLPNKRHSDEYNLIPHSPLRQFPSTSRFAKIHTTLHDDPPDSAVLDSERSS